MVRTMDDLISRKEAIEWVQNILATHLYYHPCSKSRNVPIDEVIDRLERVPSIDAVPVRKGYWIDGWRGRLDGTRYWYRACSECDYERDDDDAEKDTNFCPNCGARMEREDG